MAPTVTGGRENGQKRQIGKLGASLIRSLSKNLWIEAWPFVLSVCPRPSSVSGQQRSSLISTYIVQGSLPPGARMVPSKPCQATLIAVVNFIGWSSPFRHEFLGHIDGNRGASLPNYFSTSIELDYLVTVNPNTAFKGDGAKKRFLCACLL